tara:strand:+ start:68 stop:1171 length:1104 start_codon:yes stop_codon:yes gene_type:complete
MNIKFLDLKTQSKEIEKKIFDSLKKNISNSSFIGGKDLIEFQKEFANFLKIKFCIGVANGTDALEIAIKALDLKEGSEIVVPANTWISTAEAVLNNNLKIKFVDVDETHNICTEDLKKKINRNTSAVIIVHLFGNPANIEAILELRRKYNFKVIEDCAQAHGAEYKGKKISTFGDIGTFSFFPSKNLGCYGDGGCIVTNQKKIFTKIKKIANHGGLKKNKHEILGRNSRLDNIQAGILRIKLQKLNQWIDLRNEQANLYFKYLVNLKKISLIKKLKKTKSSFHLMVIRTNKRNELKKYLKSKGIMTSIHYPLSLPEIPIFKKQHYGYCRKMKSLKFNRQILSLPIGEHLNLKDIKYVCNTIKSFFDD